jgi:hypothetical protein
MFFRRKEPLSDISHALEVSHEHADDESDDADAKRWARENPAKVAATKIPRWRRGGPRMVLEAAPRRDDSYTGD